MALYQDLMNLTESTEAFYFIDQSMDGEDFRIFSYRLASYSDFCRPSALESRGIMFRLSDTTIPVSRPPNKFFNLYENPFTENVDLTKAHTVMVKEDGSLISTYITNKGLRLKSKASLGSTQAIAAMEWVENHPDIKTEIQEVAESGCTLNFEYVAPDNRIVLGYTEPRLILLNVRHNETGEYLPRDHSLLRGVSPLWVETVSFDDAESFFESVPGMTGIEGFVVVLPDQMLKIKTSWYVSIHRSKDAVNTPGKVAACVIEEGIDDLYGIFSDDSDTTNYMREIEETVTSRYNHMIAATERFYMDNKDLSRKDYAIKAKGLNDGFMSLYMNLYSEKDPGYKSFALRNIDRFV